MVGCHCVGRVEARMKVEGRTGTIEEVWHKVKKLVEL